jgi:hypothetical protein
VKDLLDSSNVIDMENDEDEDYIAGSEKEFSDMAEEDGMLGDALNIETLTMKDPDDQDVVTEEDLADGTHIRKEIHTENGV